MAGVSLDAASGNAEIAADRSEPDEIFRLVPSELAAKCRVLVENYHGIHGYGSLPDVLWHSVMRDMIKRHRKLGEAYRSACKARSAKHANYSLVLIAASILALEVLARDIADWGTHLPDAKREADELLRISSLKQRKLLVDRYIATTHYASSVRALARASGGQRLP
jgi:hypothetical protein